MNKSRRAALGVIKNAIADLWEQLQDIRDEEEEYLENLPENLQESEKAFQSEMALSNLEDALLELESAESLIEEAME